jgi:hypothetical protein
MASIPLDTTTATALSRAGPSTIINTTTSVPTRFVVRHELLGLK